METIQRDMIGEDEKVGLGSDDTMMDWVKVLRKETD